MKTTNLRWRVIALLASGAIASMQTFTPAKAAPPFQEPVNDERDQALETLYEGITLFNDGQEERALEHFHEALAVAQQIGDLEMEVTALSWIGGIYWNWGRLDQAWGAYDRGLTAARELGNESLEALMLHNLGDIYSQLGQNDDALETYRQALTIYQGIGDRAGEGAILGRIGALHSSTLQYTQALDYLRQSLTIAQELDDREAIGTLYHDISDVYWRQGQHEESLAYLLQSLAIAQETGDRQGETTTLHNIGVTYYYMGEYDKTQEYLIQSLARYQELGDLDGQVYALENLASLHEQKGELPQAIDLYKQASEIKEDLLGEYQSEQFEALFATQQVEAYTSLVNLLWEEERFEEAFYYSERARARAFLDQLAGGEVDSHSGANAAQLEEEQELRAEITAHRRQLATLRSRPVDEWDTERIATVEESLSSLETEYAELLTRIRLQSPESASLVSVDVATLEEVQGLLDQNTILIVYFVAEYFIGEIRSGEAGPSAAWHAKDLALAFVISAESFETVQLDVNLDELTQTIAAFRSFANLRDPHPASLQQLYAGLIAPLEPYLDKSTIVVVPHGVLHYLPFAALTNGERYLSDDHTIIALPSASALRYLDASESERGSLLALGNPVIDASLSNLHFAEQEVRTIASLYDTQPLVGVEATETAVRAQAGEATILHLAAHGELNADNPLFSAIHLASDDANDGRLEVHEIYSLDLTTVTDLVVLSACNTHMGEVSAGDEVVGLNRAFLYAGTPTVVASLWNVDDEATALLMERFYTHLREGMGKAEALRQAQMDVRAEYPHPYYWAAFVLTGDGGPVSAEMLTEGAQPTLESEVKAVAEPPEQEAEPDRRGWCPASFTSLALAVLAQFARRRQLGTSTHKEDRDRAGQSRGSN